MQAGTSGAAPPRATGASRLGALALVLAVGVCYANSLSVPFLLDDPLPTVTLDYSNRPLVTASFALNRAVSGPATWSFHVFNALVHLGCGFLLLGILRRSMALAAPRLAASTREKLALVTTLAWLCHPLATASVTYLSQRAEAMAVFFYLAVLYAFLRSTAAARPLAWQALAFVALALGFATKEIVVTAPLFVFLLDALLVAAGARAAVDARPWFHGLLALSTLALAATFVSHALWGGSTTTGLHFAEFGPLEYARTEAGVVLHYLRLAVWPWPLCFDYGWPIARELGQWLPQTAVIAALLAGTAVLCLRRSWVGLAGAAFFVVLAPTSSFVPVKDPAFEHRVYLPLAAVVLLAVAGGWRLFTRFLPAARALLPVVATALVLALAALTIRRNRDYRSPLELWQRTVECAPEHARARGNLGGALLDAGRTEEAIEELLAALRLDPHTAYTTYLYVKLGTAYWRLQQPERAMPFFEQAVALYEDPDSLNALGYALYLRGDDAGAAARFERSLALQPGDARIRCRLATSLAHLGRAQEAEQHFARALALAPELEEAQLGLAELLVAQGRTDEALEHYRRALALPPDSAEEHFALANLLRSLARFDEAMRSYLAAHRLAPELPAPCAAYAATVCAKPDATAEERREALRLAQRANERTKSAQPEFLEVEAMARAAVGEFERAVQLVEQALALPGAAQDPALAEKLRAERDEYRARAGR